MREKKPTLCVVAGPNGSGKTTTTVQLLNDEWTADSLYINPDNIAQDTFGDWNSPNAVLKAAALATQQRYDCLRQGRNFVFETVFSSPWCSVSFYTVRAHFQHGLVVVDHHRPLAESLSPESRMRTFSGAGWGCKEINFSVHRDRGAVHQQDVIIQQLPAQLAVHQDILLH